MKIYFNWTIQSEISFFSVKFENAEDGVMFYNLFITRWETERMFEKIIRDVGPDEFRNKKYRKTIAHPPYFQWYRKLRRFYSESGVRLPATQIWTITHPQTISSIFCWNECSQHIDWNCQAASTFGAKSKRFCAYVTFPVHTSLLPH